MAVDPPTAATALVAAAGEGLVGDAAAANPGPPSDDPMPSEPVDGCVFCHPELTPAPLAETRSLRLVPDLYPVAPGHLLVISKPHLACFGAAPPAVLDELEELSQRARGFIRDSYRLDPVIWENGVSGQTVFHAHLHLIPVHLEGLIETLAADPESLEIEGWEAVRERYRAHGSYHYAAIGDQRWLLEGNGAMNWEVRRLIAVTAGLRYIDGRWVRPTTNDDVQLAARRWQEWTAAELTT
ncbi:MAG TPA: HIT family protein [Candidatus Solibacter sp.]|nr:HIT family protein [Candidatus Solibacter sp.]